jgi:kynureninase
MLSEADIRSRFSRVLERDEVYLANHSLGRPLDRVAEDVRAGLDLWYGRMDDAWEPWIVEMDLWRANVARLVGARRPDAVVPKTSAGQGLRAALNSFNQYKPVKVITTSSEFDSIDFILKTYHHKGRANVTWVEPDGNEGPVPTYTVDSILSSAAFQAVPRGLIVISQVFFSTGQILQDVEKLIQAAHEKGWLVLLDLYHAGGVIPLDFDRIGADFGIGGSYKYLRGGPGACWLALGQRVLEGEFGLRSLDTGWFAKKDTFGYVRPDEPQFSAGGNGWLESTPPVLMPYQAKSGLELALELGVENLREHSLGLQQRMREIFSEHGIELFQPEDPCKFGAFSLLPQSNASEFCAALKVKGVNTDSRGDFVRFGPDLLNSEDELVRAAEIVRATL